MKHRKPFVMDKEMLELTDKVRKVILKEEVLYVGDPNAKVKYKDDGEPLITHTDENGRVSLVLQKII